MELDRKKSGFWRCWLFLVTFSKVLQEKKKMIQTEPSESGAGTQHNFIRRGYSAPGMLRISRDKLTVQKSSHYAHKVEKADPVNAPKPFLPDKCCSFPRWQSTVGASETEPKLKPISSYNPLCRNQSKIQQKEAYKDGQCLHKSYPKHWNCEGAEAPDSNILMQQCYWYQLPVKGIPKQAAL